MQELNIFLLYKNNFRKTFSKGLNWAFLWAAFAHFYFQEDLKNSFRIGQRQNSRQICAVISKICVLNVWNWSSQSWGEDRCSGLIWSTFAPFWKVVGSGCTFLRYSKRVLVSVLTQMLLSYLKSFCSFQDLFRMDGELNSGQVTKFQIKPVYAKGERKAMWGGREKTKSRKFRLNSVLKERSRSESV